MAKKSDNLIQIIGVAGGSCSGKTTLANQLEKVLQSSGINARILGEDHYYFDQSNKFDHDGGNVNFDHPDALDFLLLRNHLMSLQKGELVYVPKYDFITHSRAPNKDWTAFPPPAIIILEGILILHDDLVYPLLDESIFIDITEEIRFQRRLDRDSKERGRSIEGIKAQFFTQVKPMHDQFVEASKIRASIVVKSPKDWDFAIGICLERCQALFVSQKGKK